MGRPSRRTSMVGGVVVLLLSGAGCRPDVGGPLGVELPDVSGVWEYSATGVRAMGVGASGDCRIEDVTLTIAPWRTTGFFGRSEGGRLVCGGALQALSAELESYPIRRGGMVSNHIAFDFGNPDWRHQGFMEADSMWGTFLLRNPAADMTGTFRVIRRSTSRR